MGEPPLLVGAVHDTDADASLELADTLVGAPGTVGACGVTRLLGAESGPEPCALLASTSNWYVTPLTSPVTVAVAGTTVDPGTAVTVPSGTSTLLLAKVSCTV